MGCFVSKRRSSSNNDLKLQTRKQAGGEPSANTEIAIDGCHKTKDKLEKEITELEEKIKNKEKSLKQIDQEQYPHNTSNEARVKKSQLEKEIKELKRKLESKRIQMRNIEATLEKLYAIEEREIKNMTEKAEKTLKEVAPKVQHSLAVVKTFDERVRQSQL